MTKALTAKRRRTARLPTDAHRLAAERLAAILSRLRARIDDSFAGVGIVVYQSLDALPVSNLRSHSPPELPLSSIADIAEALLRYAARDCCYHDGFHLLSADGDLTHVAHYFAPPIVPTVEPPDDEHRHGGRYRAALYGSRLPVVLATGVLTRSYGPLVFVQGVPCACS
jgi:hypothetical protein